RTRERPGAVEDLFREPQGLQKGVEAFEILKLTREALVVEALSLQVRGSYYREGKMLYTTPHIPIFGMGELPQDGHGDGPLPHPLDKGWFLLTAKAGSYCCSTCSRNAWTSARTDASMCLSPAAIQ